MIGHETLRQLLEPDVASVYGDGLQGGATASSEPYDRDMLTAAHRTLPLGSRARVTNLKNNKSVIVRINDRGPHTAGRILDLSRSAAERLGVRTGVVRVRVGDFAACRADQRRVIAGAHRRCARLMYQA